MVTQDLAYEKGGGYVRCLTLFANVDPSFINDSNLNTKEEYGRHVTTINNQLPASMLKSLRWDSEIHELTKSLYRLEYKHGMKYDAINV